MQISDALRNTIADAIGNAVENGAGTSVAKFQNSAQTATYATCNLATNAFDAAPDPSAGQITLNGTPTEASASVGTATRIGFYDGATPTAALVFTLGLNDTGSPEMSISNNAFSGGESVAITSLVITVPAGTPDAT